MITKENQKFLEYIHICYGKELGFEKCSEADKYMEDAADDMLKIPEYKLMSEFEYIKKLSHRYKVNIDFKTIDSLVFRGMRAENIYLWRSVWYISNIEAKDLVEKYKFRPDEANRILCAFNKALTNEKNTKLLGLERSLRTWLRLRFDGKRFLAKEFKRDDYSLMAVGIKDNDFWCFSLKSADGPDNNSCIVELYQGILSEKSIKLVNKGVMRYGKEICMDYDLVRDWIDIENMDIWWVFM